MQERELKLAADAVLSEVRRKQADSKRMLDILKALEKLRKLRKEAASKKGVHLFCFLFLSGLFLHSWLTVTLGGTFPEWSLTEEFSRTLVYSNNSLPS